MTFDRSDYDERLRRDLETRRSAAQPAIRQLQQAAVALENLTGGSDWDYFLSLVQAFRESKALERDNARSQMLDIGNSMDALRRWQMVAHAASEVVDALDFVIAIPKQAIDQAHAVKDISAPKSAG